MSDREERACFPLVSILEALFTRLMHLPLNQNALRTKIED